MNGVYSVTGPIGFPTMRVIQAKSGNEAARIWRDVQQTHLRRIGTLGEHEDIGPLMVRVVSLRVPKGSGELVPGDDAMFMVNGDLVKRV